MTAEQLEELLGKVTQVKAAETYDEIMKAFPGPPIVGYLCRENAHLTRKVIAADKLVKSAQALCDRWDTSDWGGSLLNTRHTMEFIADLRRDVTAYRESGK